MLAALRSFMPLLIAATIAAPAAAAVSVSFVNPERYTDAGQDYAETETTLRTLERHFLMLGKRYLTPRQTLTVEMLDIDLAGRYEPWGRDFRWVRIVRDRSDFPLLKFRYVLEADGRIVASGEESIADTSALSHGTIASPGTVLRIEKRMLDDWFRARFAERVPAQGR